jgi:general secretion pathway protein J
MSERRRCRYEAAPGWLYAHRGHGVDRHSVDDHPDAVGVEPGRVSDQKIVEAKMSRYRVARLAMDRILRDVQMAYLSNNNIPGTEQTPRTYFDGVHRPDIDELRFTYFGHQRLYADSKEGDTAAVGYFGQRDKSDGGKLNLWRKETRRIQAERIDNGNIPGEAEVIADDVLKLELTYYEPVRKEWLETWRTNQADGMPNRLPSRVRVKLVIRDERGEELPLQSEVRIAMFQLLDTKPN